MTLDIRDMITILTDSQDTDLLQIGSAAERYLLGSVTESAKSVLDKQEEITNDVLTSFPTPFAVEFEKWCHSCRRLAAIAQADEAEYSSVFFTAFGHAWRGWGQIVRYLPFVLLVPLEGLPTDDLEKRGGSTLLSACRHYEKFYNEEYERDNEQFDSEQFRFLDDLVKLYRQLSGTSGSTSRNPPAAEAPNRPGLPESFFFNPLLGATRDFESLFPIRFIDSLEFIRAVRNRVVHGDVAMRPRRYLQVVQDLVAFVYLDIVSIIAPLARAYGMYYVSAIDRTASPLMATAFSFVGKSGGFVHFRLRDDGDLPSDRERFALRHIYLVDRRCEMEADPQAALLEPSQYIDLTPFLIDLRRLNTRGPSAEPALSSLRRYQPEKRRQFIRFWELSGRSEARLPQADTPSLEERTELDDLLPGLVRLSNLVRGFSQYLEQVRIDALDFNTVRSRIWERVSKDQLSECIDVSRVNASGRVLEDSKRAPRSSAPEAIAYERDLFVPPAQVRAIDEFFGSDKRGLLLVGGSGYGKTTLIVDTYLKRLRSGDIALFLTGRKLAKPELREILADAIKLVATDCTVTDLSQFVTTTNVARKKSQQSPTQITLFLDAVNEFTAGGGAFALLREVLDLVRTRGDVMFGAPLPSLRVVATCRSETWERFKDSIGAKQTILDPRWFFCAPNGDAVVVDGFGDGEARRTLYAKYREYYNLLPTSYDGLSTRVTDLFGVPLMLSLVAQTYDARAANVPARIPRDLSYFDVFHELTERKLKDARFLVPFTERRTGFTDSLSQCIFEFALVLYERMTLPKDPHDYVKNALADRGALGSFKADRDDRQLTEFRALLEIGLLSEKYVAERDRHKNVTQGRAYTFFHDRYTEYQIATVYEERVLGSLAASAPARGELDRIVAELVTLTDRGIRIPVLTGAIEHWFHIQLAASHGKVQTLMPLCKKMVESDSPPVRALAGGMLTRLILHGAVRSDDLYKAAFAQGSRKLKTDLAAAYSEAWPGLDSAAARSFLNTCHPERDERAIETLADVFVEHGNAGIRDSEGLSAVGFVSQVFPGLLAALKFDSFKSHLAFLIRFAQMLIVTNAERPAILFELRDFLKGEFRPLLYVVTGKTTGNPIVDLIPNQAHKLFRDRLERSMYAAWESAISCGGVNDTFFVDEGGVVQREVMETFVPSMCALHNGDFAELSMHRGSRFRDLCLMMLNYRQYSIIGFAAYVVMTIAFRDDYRSAIDFATELTREGSSAGRFVAINIVENFCLINPVMSLEALNAVERDLLPPVKDDPFTLAHLLVCAAGIVEGNIAERWSALEPSLDSAFEHVLSTDDEPAIQRFCEELRCLMFFGSIEIGSRTIVYLLERGYLDESSPWYPGALEMCVGMAVRRRSELGRLFAEFGIPEEVLRRVDTLRTQAVLDQERTFGARARWNSFFCKSIAFNAKLRYLLIKYMFGSLAFCNNVAEWAHQMGTFMIEAIRAYSEDDEQPEEYATITLEEILAAVPFRAERGKGRAYEVRV